jgi:2-hydroxychromene-2-carboxylate isomerase
LSDAKKKIAFCFDFLSPYAYLAWGRIHRIAEAAGREVEPWPVVFAGLLDAHGTKGPAEIPAKRRYLVKDVLRIADRFGMPIAAPRAMPFRSLHALRLVSVPMPRDRQRALIDRIYEGVWARGEDAADLAQLAAIAREVGVDDDVVAAAESPENKERLRARTAQAVALGVFGVPTAIADRELFWGTDSLPHLERFLGGADPIDERVVAAFATATVGATRKNA